MSKNSDAKAKLDALNEIIRACDASIAADVGGYKVKTGISIVDDMS